MDERTARQEAIAFCTSPRGAMTYQIGKLANSRFLPTRARSRPTNPISARSTISFWKNGNVPIALAELGISGRCREAVL